MNRNKDIRVEVRLRNNIILQFMEGKGIKSVAELCHEARIPRREEARVERLIDMLELPYEFSKEGMLVWHLYVEQIARVFKVLPDMLFSQEQMKVALKQNQVHFEMASGDVRGLFGSREQQVLPDVTLERKQLRMVLRALISKLPPQQAKALMLRFGLHDGVEGRTFEDVANLLKVSRGRAHQLEVKALKTLRQPHNVQALEEAGALQHCG